MKKLKIISVVGARPNFMKIAPLLRAFKKYPQIENVLVHTGQHYDNNMSHSFFRELDIPKPKVNLEVGSGSHAVQTALIMQKFEPVIEREKPDLVIVVGDVNSTIACTMVAKKMGVKVAHVEAGLRSFDMTMPEEINRKLTDSISDLLFTTSKDADFNLAKEGVDRKNIFLVGNCMIDTLYYGLEKIKNRKNPYKKLGDYCVLTLHRPGNVDNRETLSKLLEEMNEISLKLPVVFSIHPRTNKRIEEFKLQNLLKKMTVLGPLPYLDFLNLYKDAKFILTDSGGIQEEASVLNVPCITLRENTERPVTVTHGSNILVGNNIEKINKSVRQILLNKHKKSKSIRYWDGGASDRIVKVILKKLPK